MVEGLQSPQSFLCKGKVQCRQQEISREPHSVDIGVVSANPQRTPKNSVLLSRGMWLGLDAAKPIPVQAAGNLRQRRGGKVQWTAANLLPDSTTAVGLVMTIICGFAGECLVYAFQALVWRKEKGREEYSSMSEVAVEQVTRLAHTSAISSRYTRGYRVDADMALEQICVPCPRSLQAEVDLDPRGVLTLMCDISHDIITMRHDDSAMLDTV